MSDAARAYRKFCRAHGGEENAVVVDGRTIFPDGTEAVGEGGCVMLLDHDENANRYFGPSQKLHMRRTKAANVVLHRQTLYEIAVDEFEGLKLRLKGSGDRGGLKRLEALKAKVLAARREVRRAERQAEKVEPDYVPPAERRQMDEMEAEEQERIAEYDATLHAIRL